MAMFTREIKDNLNIQLITTYEVKDLQCLFVQDNDWWRSVRGQEHIGDNYLWVGVLTMSFTSPVALGKVPKHTNWFGYP